MNPKRFAYLIFIIVIGDMLTTLAFNLKWPFWNFGILIKSLVEVLLLVYILVYKKLNYVVILLFIFLIPLLINILTLKSINFKILNLYSANFEDVTNPLISAIIVFNRYIFIFLLFPFFYLYRANITFSYLCKRIFNFFIYSNSFFIIIGFIFKIDIFSSYNPQAIEVSYNPRVGYKGLLYGTNEVAGIYFLALGHCYRQIFRNKENYLLMLLLVIICCFLTGTKSSLLSLLLLTLYYLYNYKKRWFYFALSASSGCLFFVSYNYDIINLFLDNLNIYLDFNGFDSSLLGTAITVFMTGRNIYVYNNFVYIVNNWNFSNYFFGDSFLYSETDLFDLYYFFGFFSFLYFFIFVKFVNKICYTPDSKGVLIILLLIAFTGGHILRSAVFPVFFCLYLVSGNFFIQNKVVKQ